MSLDRYAQRIYDRLHAESLRLRPKDDPHKITRTEANMAGIKDSEIDYLHNLNLEYGISTIIERRSRGGSHFVL